MGVARPGTYEFLTSNTFLERVVCYNRVNASPEYPMALSTLETKIANRVGLGSLIAGTSIMGLSMANGYSPSMLMASTGAYAVGAGSYAVRHLYDHAGQKLAVWKATRTSEMSVRIASAADAYKVATRLQQLEHAIDHRVDVITDSASARGQVAMGAWVHAAKTVLQKAALFDVAGSPVDRDPAKLPSDWPKVARQLESRMTGYQRMLRSDPAKPVTDTIMNFDYPST